MQVQMTRFDSAKMAHGLTAVQILGQYDACAPNARACRASRRSTDGKKKLQAAVGSAVDPFPIELLGLPAHMIGQDHLIH